MKKVVLVAAALSLLVLPACSAKAADECGMTGEWYSFRWAHNNGGQVHWKENGQHQGVNLTSDKPITFSSDGNITGGRTDGVPLGGGVNATAWQCQGTERFVMKGDFMGIQKRIQVHPEGFWEFRGTGFATYYVKSNDGIEEAAKRLLYFMELRAKHQGRQFSRD